MLSLRTRNALSATMLVAAAVVLGGCDDNPHRAVTPPQLWTGKEGAADRSWSQVRWDSLWTYGSFHDTLLTSPAYLRAHNGKLLLLDRIRQTVMCFGDGGELLWQFGGLGSGPEELRNVRDIQIGNDGSVYVNDPENGRITVLSSNGELVALVPTTAVPRAEDIAPLSDNEIVLVTVANDRPVVLIDTTGRVTADIDMPWALFNELSLVVRQGPIAVDGQRWAYLFSQGNGWFGFMGTSAVVSKGRFVEHEDFPAMLVTEHTRALLSHKPCTACSASLFDDSLFVHFGGSSRDAMAVVDVYSFVSGDYRYSFRIPRRATAVAVAGNGLVYWAATDPVPKVGAWRRQEARE